MTQPSPFVTLNSFQGLCAATRAKSGTPGAPDRAWTLKQVQGDEGLGGVAE